MNSNVKGNVKGNVGGNIGARVVGGHAMAVVSTISDMNETNLVPMTPYDASVHFTGSTPVDYSMANHPAWMAIDPVTGIISGTPNVIAVTPNIVVSADNDFGIQADSNGFTMTVT